MEKYLTNKRAVFQALSRSFALLSQRVGTTVSGTWDESGKRILFRYFGINIIVALLFSQFMFSPGECYSQAKKPKRFHPQKLHAYPRSAVFVFGSAVPEFLGRYDLVMTKVGSGLLNGIGQYDIDFMRRVREINPNVIDLTIRDWNNMGEEIKNLPEGWWLKTSTGDRIELYGPGSYWTDLSIFCPPLAGNIGGLAIEKETLAQWFGKFMVELNNKVGGQGVATQGLYYRGHVSWYGFEDVDMDRNGVDDNKEHGKSWYVDKWVRGVDILIETIRQKLNRNQYIVINTGSADMPRPDLINGLYFENDNALWNWEQTLKQSREQQKAVVQPPIFVSNYELDPRDPRVPQPTQDAFESFRFGLARAMLLGQYLDADPFESGEHNTKSYYDEFDLDIGWPTSEPTQVKSTGSDGYGVWVRFFDDGLVIGNMDRKPNRVTDADLRSLPGYNGPYYRFLGNQEIAVNNGQVFTEIELQGHEYVGYGDVKRVIGDGVVLVRQPTVSVADIVVDNAVIATTAGAKPAILNGSWSRYNSGYCSRCLSYEIHGVLNHDAVTASQSGAYAEYRPQIKLKGKYEVYEWHPRLNGASSTRVEVGYNGGKRTLAINQSINADRWNLIGTFEFGGSPQEAVTIYSDGNTVVADAFMFVYADGNNRSDRDVVPPKPPTNVKVQNNGL